MYVASCHHLAETYRRLGLPDLAGLCARDAYRRLRQIIRDPALPMELRRCCTEELGHALIPLLSELSQDAAGRPEAAHLIGEARQLTMLMQQAPAGLASASATVH